MASWTNVPDSNLEPGKPGRSVDIIAIRDNITAAFEKAPGAPVLANDYIVEAMISPGAVSAGKLKTALNDFTFNGNATGAPLLTGGQYCFLPTASIGPGGSSDDVYWAVAGGIRAGAATSPGVITGDGTTVPGLGNASRGVEYAMVTYKAGSDDSGHRVRVRYIQASPPYDPFGLGDHLLFVYALLEKATGKISVVSTAEDPPWANNGPTPVNPLDRMRKLCTTPDPYKNPNATQEDFERYWAELRMLHENLVVEPARERERLKKLTEDPALKPEERKRYAALLRTSEASAPLLTASMLPPLTQEEKNRDMDLIPHPFPHDPETHQVVLLAGDVVEKLWLRERYTGDSAGEIVAGGWLQIDNEPIRGAKKYPRDCMLAAARFKLTR